MSFRSFLIFLSSILLIWGSLTVFITSLYVKDRILEVAPGGVSPEIVSTIQTVLLLQVGLLLFLCAALIVFLYWVFNTYIVKPIREIVHGVEAFSERSERLAFSDMAGAPGEIQELAAKLLEFASKVEQAHARDVEVSRMKSDFISTAAHQFRTPLTGIRWALEALEKEPLNEGQLALVASARDKSRQLVTIVGTLLDISSIESGKYKYQFKPVHLESIAAKAVEDFRELAERSQVNLLFVPPQLEVPKVNVDQERIVWVLNNIIENGIRYTPAGGSVKVVVEATATRIYVHVRDTGIGIKPEDRGNIFERFYRAENAIAKENAGNGLGLYIARTIATDHGGDLNFRPNEDGPGTTFSLSLPLVS